MEGKVQRHSSTNPRFNALGFWKDANIMTLHPKILAKPTLMPDFCSLIIVYLSPATVHTVRAGIPVYCFRYDFLAPRTLPDTQWVLLQFRERKVKTGLDSRSASYAHATVNHLSNRILVSPSIRDNRIISQDCCDDQTS